MRSRREIQEKEDEALNKTWLLRKSHMHAIKPGLGQGFSICIF